MASLFQRRRNRATQTERVRERKHEGFLRYAGFRWAKISGGLCLLIITLQLMTAPVSANLVARSASRSGLVEEKELLVNHLAEDLQEAGYSRPGE